MCRLQKICDLRGWPAGSEKNTETHEVMLKIWEGLRSKADKDNDGQVSVAFSRSITIIIIALCQLEFVFARPQKNAYKILRCQLLVPSSRFWLFVLLWHSMNKADNYKNCYYKVSFAQPHKRLAHVKLSVYPFILIFYCYRALT